MCSNLLHLYEQGIIEVVTEGGGEFVFLNSYSRKLETIPEKAMHVNSYHIGTSTYFYSNRACKLNIFWGRDKTDLIQTVSDGNLKYFPQFPFNNPGYRLCKPVNKTQVV